MSVRERKNSSGRSRNGFMLMKKFHPIQTPEETSSLTERKLERDLT